MTPEISSKTAILGFVGIVVAVLTVKQAPPTLAQEESDITDAAESASCANVCNTFVPSQTEDECQDLYWERFNEEERRHLNTSVRLKTRRQEEWDESTWIFFDEMEALEAVRDERIKIASGVYMTRIARERFGISARRSMGEIH